MKESVNDRVINDIAREIRATPTEVIFAIVKNEVVAEIINAVSDHRILKKPIKDILHELEAERGALAADATSAVSEDRTGLRGDSILNA